MLKKQLITIPDHLDKKRLDICVSYLVPELTRSQIKTLKAEAKDNRGNLLKWSHRCFVGEIIEIFWEPSSVEEMIQELSVSDINLEILWENSDCLVVNKPAGMVVHPGISHSKDTLVNALLSYVSSLKETFQEDSLRPGIVHRLDKDTSGVIICAKTTQALEKLAKQFRNRQTEKFYLAIVKGRLSQIKGEVSGFLKRDARNRQKYILSSEEKGKESLTHWKIIREWEKFSLILLKPVTGRTHQLRVHMLAMNSPIIGDPLYSRNSQGFSRLFLHAWRIKLQVFDQFGEYLKLFEASIPKEFLDFFEEQESDFKEKTWFKKLVESDPILP